MATSYDVRIWSTEIYRGARTTSYVVRWRVGTRRFKQRYKTAALADGFRSDLVSAARRGEPFDVDSGRPASLSRSNRETGWFEFACAYVDMKWGPAAATYRRSISELLTAITPALLDGEHGRPDPALVRRALHRWAFNTARRDEPDCPADVQDALRWIESHTLPVARLAEPAVLRQVLDTISRRLDGQPAAGSVVSKRRRVLFNVVEYAVERGHLSTNPLPAFKWKAPRVATSVDRRTVVNPVQARTLLAAVRETRRSGPQLVAFFALMYFSALRPEEVVVLRKNNISLPDVGWGNCTSRRPGRTPGRTGRTTGASVTSASSRTAHAARAGPCRVHRS